MNVEDILDWAVVSDLHCGCQLALCPPEARLDHGGVYASNIIQDKIWKLWRFFWDEWVPARTKRRPYGIVINGDLIDNRHHGTVAQISQQLTDQKRICKAVLEPEIAKAKALYVVRGTEAHGGPSSEIEEGLAEDLGAIPNELGQYARPDLWKRIGKGLVHFLHHIGSTSSQAYETSALMRELIEEYATAARWTDEPPDVIIRSHRHASIKIELPRDNKNGIAFITPGWQAKGGLAMKIAGARVTMPQFGGCLIRQGDPDLYVLQYVQTIGRSPTA